MKEIDCPEEDQEYFDKAQWYSCEYCDNCKSPIKSNVKRHEEICICSHTNCYYDIEVEWGPFLKKHCFLCDKDWLVAFKKGMFSQDVLRSVFENEILQSNSNVEE